MESAQRRSTGKYAQAVIGGIPYLSYCNRSRRGLAGNLHELRSYAGFSSRYPRIRLRDEGSC